MAVPLDAIRAIHNALRKDLDQMDSTAYLAERGRGDLDLVLKRYPFFNEILAVHAAGEEEYVFPALENVAPLVAEAYQLDHRGLDSLTESLNKAIIAKDTPAIARTTAAFNFFLDHHLDSEEIHLYRLFNDRLAIPDQALIVGKVAQKLPQERFPEMVAWLFPLVGPNDQENMTRILRQMLPPPAFSGATQLIKAAVGDGWEELNRRIPDLK
jgi:hypothetical protein